MNRNETNKNTQEVDTSFTAKCITGWRKRGKTVCVVVI